MPYVSGIRLSVVFAVLSACATGEEPSSSEGLIAEVSGRFIFSPSNAWTGEERVAILDGGEVLCEEVRETSGVGTPFENCESCDIAIDVVESPSDQSCPLAAETEPRVWIPGRYIALDTTTQLEGIRSGALQVSEDQQSWEAWSNATLDGSRLSYAHEIELTAERPEDFGG